MSNPCQILNNKIDKSLKTSWCIELEDGSKIFDKKSKDSIPEWVYAKKIIENNSLKIKRIHLFSIKNTTSDENFNGAITPIGKKAYILIRQVGGWLGGPGVEYTGIGWLDDAENVFNIKFYDNDLTCVGSEKRKVEAIKIKDMIIYNEQQTIQQPICA